TIHELHRRRVRHLGREGDPCVAPAPGTELAALTEDWHREGTRLERCGYCYLDELARTYRKTLKVAYLIQWKLLPPIVQWRTRLRDRRARRMWCELGMD